MEITRKKSINLKEYKQKLSNLKNRGRLEENEQTQKFPDIPVSLEGNTEVPGTTSSEPLLPF